MADCCDVFKMVDEGDSMQSWNGLRGPYYIPHLSADGVLSWTNTGNLPNPTPVDISGPPGVSVELRGPVASVQDLPATASSSELWLVGTASPYDGYFFNGVQWENAGPVSVGPPGPAGEDGVSPEVTIAQISGGHSVTITDAAHPQGQQFDVLDGTDGAPGSPGTPGVSPEVSVDTITGGHRVTITDAEHPQGLSFDVLDGEDGSPGAQGAPGVSPEVSVETITGGHRITITDAAHPQGLSFDVLDGEDGSPGAQGAPGVSPEVSVETITGGHRVTITDASGTRSFDVMDGQDAAQETQIQIALSASWTGSGPYTQTVTVSGGTANSIISLQPSPAQAAQLIQDGAQVLQIDNNNGTFTATAIGAAPSSALTLQATRREVAT